MYSPSKGIDEFNHLFSKYVKHKGLKETVKLFKAYRLYLIRSALGQKPENIPFHKSGKDGFPLVLKYWRIDEGTPVRRVRYVISIWRMIDLVRLKPSDDVSSIVQKPTFDVNLLNEIADYSKKWKYNEVFHSCTYQGNLVLSNKAGPNGPASASCLNDIGPLMAEEELSGAVQDLLEITVPGLSLTQFHTYPEHQKFRHSKLVFLSDKAGKTRIVAIGDWWSNTALSGIHNTYMSVLKRVPTDVTFRQSEIPKLIKGLGNEIYTSDLTNFTDRLPRLLSTIHMNSLKPSLGELWNIVIGDRAFDHGNAKIKYSSGTPMGFLSSWPVATVTHHIIIHYCISKLSLEGKVKYLILGDDNIMNNESCYNMYIDVMQRLGVHISLSKCTKSKQGNAEFAKRLFGRGVELTGLPVDLLQDLNEKPEQFIELLRILRERGYSDNELEPSFRVLIAKNKNSKLLADLLALPCTLIGQEPLLEPSPSSWSEIISGLSEDTLNSLISIARDSEFYELVNVVEKPQVLKEIRKNLSDMPNNHPLVFAISEKLQDGILFHDETGEDEYSIYNAWLRGEYRQLAVVPTLSAYAVKNKGHFVTRCQ